MRRCSLLLLCLGFLPSAVFPQNGSSDSQLTQALLNEIRGLRQDLQATAATIQRVQIVMYRLQAETAMLNRASQRADDARYRCQNLQQQHKQVTSQIEQAEATQRTSQQPTEQKFAEQNIARLKPQIEMVTTQEQQCQVSQIDAESELRTERVKMSELQDQFDKLDKILADYGKK
jgi:hypothetical protein